MLLFCFVKCISIHSTIKLSHPNKNVQITQHRPNRCHEMHGCVNCWTHPCHWTRKVCIIFVLFCTLWSETVWCVRFEFVVCSICLVVFWYCGNNKNTILTIKPSADSKALDFYNDWWIFFVLCVIKLSILWQLRDVFICWKHCRNTYKWNLCFGPCFCGRGVFIDTFW